MSLLKKLQYYLIKKPSLLIQSNFIIAFICVILIIWIGNYILICTSDDNIDVGDTSSSKFVDTTHYTFTTLSSVGYGDILPKSSIAKVWASLSHMLIILMSYKLFEYVYDPNSTTLQTLLKKITEVEHENNNLKNKNLELIKEYGPKIRWKKSITAVMNSNKNDKIYVDNE